MTYRVIWLKEFKTFKDKSNAFNHTGMNSELAQMIKKWHLPGQKLAVGKQEHKSIIEQKLKISCLFNDAVMEVMWGIKHLMKSLVPQEESELPMEERLQMSYGLKTVLNRHGFSVKPEMVNERIIDTACVLYDCDLCETKHSEFLLSAGECIMEVSGIACQGWSLMKIATALKVLYDPETDIVYDDPESMLSKDELLRLKADARLYDGKLLKRTGAAVYNEIVWAREVKDDATRLLNILVHDDGHAALPQNSVPPGRGDHALTLLSLEVEKQEGRHMGMPENPPMPLGRAGSISEPAVQEVKQEMV
ncbi:uncharacterized protein LOC120704315 isoform X3 [Panicum virgatum]|nr:uncharacterized protein LOC120704315 isoform X3 [Panicum virgatum]XP_039844598.1 uncharacterized protein LOC120704315 isoform X3 [Panicum virgatum]